MRKTFVFAALMLLAGFVLLWFAIYYQQRVVAGEEFFSTMVGKSIPRAHFELVASTRRRIPLFAAIGIMLCVVGGFLLCLPKLLSLQRATVILLPERHTPLYSKIQDIRKATKEVEKMKQEILKFFRWYVSNTEDNLGLLLILDVTGLVLLMIGLPTKEIVLILIGITIILTGGEIV